MKTTAILPAAIAIALTIGCSEQQQSGPAEKAGKAIDQTVEEAGRKTEEALGKAEDYTGEKLKEAGEVLEKAGDDL
jgi:hypothetical protein